MNPLTNVKNIQKLNQRELELGVIGKKSWHDEYKDSAWVFIGGLPFDLTEGDIVCVFSQYGEIVNINLVRDKGTGKSKGFAFLCYEDQRSTVLAVDNLNSVKVLGRIIRVDHVSDYKKPKEKGDEDDVTLQLRAEGCAPKAPAQTQSSPLDLSEEPPTIRPPQAAAKSKKDKKVKKEKKKKKKKKKMKVTVKVEQRSGSDSSSDSDDEDHHGHRKSRSLAMSSQHSQKLKREKHDIGYDRAVHGHKRPFGQSDIERGYDDRKRDRREPGAGDRDGERHRDSLTDRRYKEEPSDPGRDRSDDFRRDDRRERDERSSHKNDRDRDDRRDRDDQRDRDGDDRRGRDRDDGGDRDRDGRREKERDEQRDGESGRDNKREKNRDRDDYDRRRR
ncbi:RNA-binding motif protein, X-linked 2-like [Littorina saxatilis]|uniref:RNA-binding motif protein, X-linked 2 n=1 Tax=Littorina saxatilis TaxID=31220 RepID=A0AAN9G034_9CAEN